MRLRGIELCKVLVVFLWPTASLADPLDALSRLMSYDVNQKYPAWVCEGWEISNQYNSELNGLPVINVEGNLTCEHIVSGAISSADATATITVRGNRAVVKTTVFGVSSEISLGQDEDLPIVYRPSSIRDLAERAYESALDGVRTGDYVLENIEILEAFLSEDDVRTFVIEAVDSYPPRSASQIVSLANVIGQEKVRQVGQRLIDEALSNGDEAGVRSVGVYFSYGNGYRLVPNRELAAVFLSNPEVSFEAKQALRWLGGLWSVPATFNVCSNDQFDRALVMASNAESKDIINVCEGVFSTNGFGFSKEAQIHCASDDTQIQMVGDGDHLNIFGFKIVNCAISGNLEVHVRHSEFLNAELSAPRIYLITDTQVIDSTFRNDGRVTDHQQNYVVLLGERSENISFENVRIAGSAQLMGWEETGLSVSGFRMGGFSNWEEEFMSTLGAESVFVVEE